MSKGGKMEASQFLPPWREVRDGEVVEYGPRSLATFQQHIAKYRNWAFRLPSKEARADADVLIAWVIQPDGTYRGGIPSGELKVFALVYQQGHSTRYAAKHLGVSRDTVKSYMRRLRARVGR